MFTHQKILSVGMVAATMAGVISSFAATNYVDVAYKGKEATGESWSSPFSSLQMAIDAVAEAGGGEVWVKAGVYKPEGSTRNATINLKPGVSLYGGFRGKERDRASINPKTNRTLLSGDIGKPSSTSDNCYHVITAEGGNRIEGFIITRGNANSAAENRVGGAIRIVPEAEEITLANCILEKNNAEIGGAVFVDSAALSITNCTFYSNSAKTGGALATKGTATVSMENCTFSSNFAPGNGGAVMIDDKARVRITDSSFIYNTTDGTGGGICAKAEVGIELTVEGCKFNDNSAGKSGGALLLNGAFTPVIKQSIFAKNTSRKGTGAIANENGITAIIIDPVYTRNRGTQGMADVSTDSTSRISTSLEDVIPVNFTAVASTEPENAPAETVQKPKRSIPDTFVHNSDQMKVKLKSLVAANPYTILVLGEITDPNFIKSYRAAEAAAVDYMHDDVGFYYIYRHLLYPENHGYLPPHNEKERARQMQIISKQLNTQVPWLCDLMNNETAAALAPENINNVFIFNAAGQELYAGHLSDAPAIRKSLTEHAGKTPQVTPPGMIQEPAFKPFEPIETELVKRVTLRPAVDNFRALQVTPRDSQTPHYVKVRVEGNKELLESGDGKLYLGFHVDPLYNMMWNNLEDPMKYVIKTPKGVIAPSINSAPKIKNRATDNEPREFLLQARKLDLTQPIALQVSYSIHSLKTKRNVEVQHQYLIYLEEDPFGGLVIGRQVKQPNSVQKEGSSVAYAAMLRRYDINRDGKLRKHEVVGGLRTRFEEIDTDSDGTISEEEFMEYRQGRD